MPELPEVEAARRAIEENCIGKKIKRSVVADDAKVIDGVSPSDFEASLTGKTIVAAHRKGKNMWIQLDSPPFPSFQFGMAGAIYIKGVAVTKYKRSAVNDTDEWPSKYSKLFIELDDGLEVSFTDKRRFAKVRLLKNPASVAPISELGPDALLEPLTEDELFKSLSKKKIGIKALILDQSFISGVGNWIADEVLYQARIHPLQSAASISKESCAALHKSLKEVIEQAVEVGADSSQFPSNWIFHSREKKPGKAFVDDNVDSPQPTSSTTSSSSSSIDTDEYLEQAREIFIGLVREAAKLIYGSTASSSRREPRAGNIEIGRNIEFINAGGRTSAFVPELQKLSGEQAAKAAVKPQKRSSKKNKDEEDEPESSEDEEISKNAKPKGGKKTTQGRAKNPNTKRKSIGSDEGSSDADDDKKPATRKKSKGSKGNKKPPAKNAQENEEDSDDEGEEEGEEEERVQVKGKKEVAKKVQTGKQIKKRAK